MWNFAGNSRGINAANIMSLHHTNPGIGNAPVANTELTDLPYERQICAFAAPVADGPAAMSDLTDDVVFPLHLSINQNAQFVGLWDGATYLGYIVPNSPFNFTGTATTRTFKVLADETTLVRTNP